MGLFDKLRGRSKKVGPKDFAHTAVALAFSHLETLGKRIGDASDEIGDPTEQQVAALAHEILLAYFGLASLRASQSIPDDRALNRYGAEMVEWLRAYPGAGAERAELVRAAFGDDGAVSYAARLYVQGRPNSEDLDAARACTTLLRLDKGSSLLMLCAHAHIRSMRTLGISKGFLFLELWALNSACFISSVKEVLAKYEPGY